MGRCSSTSVCSKLASYEVLQITTIKCTTANGPRETLKNACVNVEINKKVSKHVAYTRGQSQRESSKHVAWTILETSTHVGNLSSKHVAWTILETSTHSCRLERLNQQCEGTRFARSNSVNTRTNGRRS